MVNINRKWRIVWPCPVLDEKEKGERIADWFNIEANEQKKRKKKKKRLKKKTNSDGVERNYKKRKQHGHFYSIIMSVIFSIVN